MLSEEEGIEALARGSEPRERLQFGEDHPAHLDVLARADGECGGRRKSESAGDRRRGAEARGIEVLAGESARDEVDQ